MYGIFAYIYHKNQPNVGKYTIHGWYGFLPPELFKQGPPKNNHLGGFFDAPEFGRQKLRYSSGSGFILAQALLYGVFLVLWGVRKKPHDPVLH